MEDGGKVTLGVLNQLDRALKLYYGNSDGNHAAKSQMHICSHHMTFFSKDEIDNAQSKDGGAESNEPIIYISQNDNWSCGYRNLQMLLYNYRYKQQNVFKHHFVETGSKDQIQQATSHDKVKDMNQVIASEQEPDSMHNERVDDKNVTHLMRKRARTIDAGRSAKAAQKADPASFLKSLPCQHSHQSVMQGVPSIAQIQKQIEESWRRGFDPKGAEHYNGHLQRKKCWIGAVEVASLLRYRFIDATVVQFLAPKRAKGSSNLLGPFVWNYFSCIGNRIETSVSVEQLIEMARTDGLMCKSDANDTQIKPTRGYSVPPLYLQWEGHSVLVVGIERISNQLIVFDPLRNGKVLMDGLKQSISTGQPCNLQKALNQFCLPLSQLCNKDCQIIHCTFEKTITEEERDAWKLEVKAITALP